MCSLFDFLWANNFAMLIIWPTSAILLSFAEMVAAVSINVHIIGLAFSFFGFIVSIISLVLGYSQYKIVREQQKTAENSDEEIQTEFDKSRARSSLSLGRDTVSSKISKGGMLLMKR
jgi:hypothetical protein